MSMSIEYFFAVNESCPFLTMEMEHWLACDPHGQKYLGLHLSWVDDSRLFIEKRPKLLYEEDGVTTSITDGHHVFPGCSNLDPELAEKVLNKIEELRILFI